jgi:hypothetical protein
MIIKIINELYFYKNARTTKTVINIVLPKLKMEVLQKVNLIYIKKDITRLTLIFFFNIIFIYSMFFYNLLQLIACHNKHSNKRNPEILWQTIYNTTLFVAVIFAGLSPFYFFLLLIVNCYVVQRYTKYPI